MKMIETSVRIGAARSRVWSVLMDFEAYPLWNPFIVSLKGDKRVGGNLEAVLTLPGGKPQTFSPVVIEFVPERVFCWRGSLPIPGLFSGEHRFTISGDGAGSTFTQSEKFTGLIVPFVGGILAATERGFQAMNDKLKTRAEGG